VNPAAAVAAAASQAAELGFPWNPANVVAERRGVWPLPRFWRVVSHSEDSAATTTFRVSERDGVARPVGIVYHRARGPAAVRSRGWSLRLVLAALAGGVAAVAAFRVLLGWPIWIVLPFAIAGALVARVLLLSQRRAPP
jgi:hypothetical protein